MCESMEFPKDIWDFIEKYCFKDEEEVYTNGARLIPVFRIAQALEHYYNYELHRTPLTD